MEPAPDTLRLPTDVRPTRYDLTVAPDLDAATFHGNVAVELTVGAPTSTIVCNAAELELSDAWVELADGGRIEPTITLDADAEQAMFDLGEEIAPGEVTLHVQFTGILNDKLRGFYRSTFVDGDGATRTIGVTQFEATDARRAFPCWDEPAFKAVFGVTLQVDADLLALSNGPELDRHTLDNGQVRITFGDTIPMSTYLVAFVVGPLVATPAVDVDGIPLRIIHKPGDEHLTATAIEVGAFALRYFADYYGIVYPGDKMDMVAVPDFAFGAMENLGCVIYRETLLLVDPATATRDELLAVVDVIAHELAHMWFGDLVTMSWWNGIWLNEAFATFMEMKCSDAFRPEWQRWMHFGRERTGAFDTDSLSATRPIEFPVISPADAEGMFDVLTYQKGSAVVRMLEQYLGEDAFRDGIRRYLSAHQFGNTETGDLWDALEAETGEPVRTMMDSWIFQGGFPIIEVSRHGANIDLTQRQFRYFDETTDATWQVPVIVRSGAGESRLVLDASPASVAVGDGPVMANAGGHGFYRVAYDDDLRAELRAGLDSLVPLERYAVLDDALALSLRGTVPAAEVAALVTRLVEIGEEDLSIWQSAASVLGTLDRVVTAADRPRWDQWRDAAVRPLWDRLGPAVAADDSDGRRALRGVVLTLMADAGAADVFALADELVTATMADPASVEAGLASGALAAIAPRLDAARFEEFLGVFRTGATPQRQIRHLYAAGRADDVALFDRYLDLMLTDEIRSQNLAFAARAALVHPLHGARAWTFLRDHWGQIVDRMPFNATHRMMSGIIHIGDADVADDIEAFMAANTVAQATKIVNQHIERMRVSVAFHEREADRFVADLT